MAKWSDFPEWVSEDGAISVQVSNEQDVSRVFFKMKVYKAQLKDLFSKAKPKFVINNKALMFFHHKKKILPFAVKKR